MFFYGIPLFVKFAGFVYDLRKSSEPVEVSDNTPPSPPYFELFPAFTNEERIEIGGNSEPGATITMSLNGKDNEVLSNNEGKFSFSLNLVKGENKISAISKDAAGNESQETDIHTINYDNSPPEIEITKPSDGSQFFGSRQRQLVIEGNTEKDARVQINDRLVVVDTNGNFTFLTVLNEGENRFNIKSQDQAGNITETSLTVKYSS